VLSTSFADSDFRDALLLLDDRGARNTAERRRHLRLELQKEVISSNGDIVDEFGRVAQVRKQRLQTFQGTHFQEAAEADACLATCSYWPSH
jgi:hypothetical protein